MLDDAGIRCVPYFFKEIYPSAGKSVTLVVHQLRRTPMVNLYPLCLGEVPLQRLSVKLGVTGKARGYDPGIIGSYEWL